MSTGCMKSDPIGTTIVRRTIARWTCRHSILNAQESRTRKTRMGAWRMHDDAFFFALRDLSIPFCFVWKSRVEERRRIGGGRIIPNILGIGRAGIPFYDFYDIQEEEEV